MSKEPSESKKVFIKYGKQYLTRAHLLTNKKKDAQEFDSVRQARVLATALNNQQWQKNWRTNLEYEVSQE